MPVSLAADHAQLGKARLAQRCCGHRTTAVPFHSLAISPQGGHTLPVVHVVGLNSECMNVFNKIKYTTKLRFA